MAVRIGLRAVRRFGGSRHFPVRLWLVRGQRHFNAGRRRSGRACSGVSVGSGSGVSVGSGVLLNMESISPGFCVSPGTTLPLSLPELLSTSMPSVSAIMNNTSIITNFAVILRLLRRRVFMRKQYLSAYLYKVFFPVLYSATRLSSSLSNFTNL